MNEDDPEESERRYQQLIQTSPAPINLFDADGKILWGNDAVVDLLALDSRDSLVGRSIFEFIEPTDRSTAKQELTEVVESKRATGPTAMELQRPDGETRTVRVATAPGQYRGKDIGQAVVIDVTELKNVQHELEMERQFIEEALDTLQDVFYVIDPDGELERWNDSLLEISGYDESAVEQMSVEEFFLDSETDRISDSIATAFAEGTDTLEATIRTKHGNTIPFEFRKRRIIRDGNIIGLVGIGRDISNRNARDQHLRAVDRLLQHNLRNQLNVIQGRVEVLKETTEKEGTEHIERIDSAAEQLLSLFDNHHSIVQLLTEKDGKATLDVVTVLESVVRESRESHPEAAITTAVPEAASVSAIPALDEALAELITNAIQHSDDPAPTVEVRVETHPETITISVIDNGPTIPEMEYESLRDGTSLSPTSHSTGLGLWLVHWIVKQSAGTLTFEQNKPEGNVVTIELPKSNNTTH